MENRDYILDVLKSRTLSIDEFNFDHLQAPPIGALFTPMDIAQNILQGLVRNIKKLIRL